MIDIRGKRVLLVGLARSGRAAALSLRRQGAIVTVTDLRGPADFRSDTPLLLKEKIGLELGLHREETFLRQDLIVVSPGVFPEPAPLQAARRRGIPVVPEVEAASWFVEGTLLGVTGTNGKTTTTTLLGCMLDASGFPTFVAGNIGTPLSSAIGQVTSNSMVVTELSSFQLETIRDLRPHVAVLLNLTPNHLDRHPDFESYVRAKAQIFRNQEEGDYAILNADDPAVVSLAPAIRSRKVFFSRKRPLPDGVFVSNGLIKYRVRNLERVLLERKDVRLRGDFNLENVLAAAAAACVVGADFESVRQAVRDFKGVEHRLELVREIRGVEFYNNSKATSVAATVNSLEAFVRGVHLILGGKDKGAPYAPIRQLLKERVRGVYLIGAAAGRIEKELSGAADLVRSGDLKNAVQQAFERSRPGDVVLLAPACSSFDQFRDYEERGRVFKELVNQLAEEAVQAWPGVPTGVQGAPPEKNVGAEGSIAEKAESVTPPIWVQPEDVPTEIEPMNAAMPGEAARVSQEGEGESPDSTKVPATKAGPLEEADTTPVLPARPELIYVYEVGAEESEPLGASAVDTPIDDLPMEPPAELRTIEGLEDEALPYEARANAAGTRGDSHKVREDSKDPDGQPRLPGI